MDATALSVGGSLGSILSSECSYACAIVQNGKVKCWGRNSHGQLGDGTNEDSSVPVQVKAPN
jgi:alpha-tubulin suppressor-like RCC1 family protein